ncbi:MULTISPECIES: flagellin [Halomonadaceae]|uniref:Flagellin n=1 Tax=Vreelandella halophila TaxID=86177 RepID=A0A9X5B483_9GAMM|nr:MULTISPECIES: flagellin [Halomonas]MYL26306.1 flagellin [Halomonas utahensis]MYL73643.1 flagellin [Halomonas sp. 22501_18_FS]
MPQIINTNIASINAQRNLDRSQEANQTALERLSSGLRINSAADDAAGLAISTRFESQTQGLAVGIRNANDGVSLAQTAEGALGSMTDNLQRIRELSLQSANATNSAQDRESLNQEVQELKAEIGRVSRQTNFNGTNLLDGSFEGANFQIGANRGETVSVNISGATPDELGAAQTDGITSSPSAQAMQGGDLVLNGFSVPSSEAGSDDTSFANNSASAIAKAAAVNERTDQSGVKAVANQTSVTGSAVGSVAGSTATITLNGVDIDMPAGTGNDVEGFLNSVAEKINKNTGQTGVEATFNGDPSVGITLTAEDGRNITLSDTDGAADVPAQYGLAGSSGDGSADDSRTYTGTYTLISEDGSDINIESDGDISRAGFQVGTFSGTNSGAAGQVVGASDMASGDITINGVPIGKSVASADTSSSTAPASSAIAKAAAINASSDATGVTASANPTLYTAGAISDNVDATFDVNGTEISVSIPSGAQPAERQTAMVDAINAKSGQTGVTAEAFTDSGGNDTFRLVAEDGRNIQVDNFTFNTGTSGDLGFGGAVTQRSSISLQSAGKIEIGTLTGNNASAGFEVGTYGSNESGQLLRDVDISTVEGANDALSAIDNALNQVNRQRASLGAIQNRFESTIENQEVASENLKAANSRIRDADFAKETAELARTQTLQQAGLSILSQANQQPQQVLQLLQG